MTLLKNIFSEEFWSVELIEDSSSYITAMVERKREQNYKAIQYQVKIL